MQDFARYCSYPFLLFNNPFLQKLFILNYLNKFSNMTGDLPSEKQGKDQPVILQSQMSLHNLKTKLIFKNGYHFINE